jgi:hypothetical protein
VRSPADRRGKPRPGQATRESASARAFGTAGNPPDLAAPRGDDSTDDSPEPGVKTNEAGLPRAGVSGLFVVASGGVWPGTAPQGDPPWLSPKSS